MRSSVCLAVTIVFIAAAVAGCGCKRLVSGARQARQAGELAADIQDGDGKVEIKDSDETVRIDTDEGTVLIEGEDGKTARLEVDEDEETTTLTTDDGEFRVGQGDSVVSEEELGLKFYPGAEVEMSSSGSGGPGAGSHAMVTLKTKDPFSEVAEFYKDHYAGDEVRTTEMTQDDMQMLTIVTTDGDSISVMRDKDSEDTRITLMRTRDE